MYLDERVRACAREIRVKYLGFSRSIDLLALAVQEGVSLDRLLVQSLDYSSECGLDSGAWT